MNKLGFGGYICENAGKRRNLSIIKCHNWANLLENDFMVGWRRFFGKFTSPVFVPLRRFVVWNDQKFGTCDMKLTLDHRWDEKNPQQNFDTISELQKKISKDNANIKGLGEKSSDRMNCWNCGTQMIWGGDHSFEDVGLDGEGIASNFSCPNCSAYADFYHNI